MAPVHIQYVEMTLLQLGIAFGVLQAFAEGFRKPADSARDLKPELDRLRRAIEQLQFQARSAGQEEVPSSESTPEPAPASFFHLLQGYPEQIRLAQRTAEIAEIEKDCGCSNCDDFGSAAILYS
jgi:hypothetical protein